jgi:hypothetical protein
MSLEDWLKNGWLKTQKPSHDEIRKLLAIVDRDLKQCQLKELSTDWRFNIAYNAALQAATAALRASGYRTTKESHHYHTIQSLYLTLKIKSEKGNIVGRLDAFRQKRAKTTYEVAGSISESELEELIELTKILKMRVEEWLQLNHPELSG